MKLIFLYFDGVLNNQLWYVKTKGNRQHIDLDTSSIQFLNTLVRETGSKVVVTSTWRLGRTIEELQNALDINGFIGEIIGKTKDLRIGEDGDSILRGNEILQWMKSHPEVLGKPYWDYKDYVILDDDSDMLYWQKDNYIYVDPYVGITPSTVFKAKKILLARDFHVLDH